MAHGPKGIPAIPPGFVVGAKAILRAARDERPLLRVIVASNAPAETVEPVRALTAYGAELVEVPSSEELGRVCGLPRPVAAAAVLRSA